MATTQLRPRSSRPPVRRTRVRRRRLRPVTLVALVLLAAVLLAGPGTVLRSVQGWRGQLAGSASAPPDDVVDRAPDGVLAPDGQSAYTTSTAGGVLGDPDAAAVPIASVAKVMTAYVVLRDRPLQPWEAGPTVVLDADDVADTQRRRAQDESVVDVEAGERLTQREALAALLLPSANNIAAVLAREVSGSEDAFVDEMNAAAAALGMTHTRYTDPSGYADTTVSTAADQVVLLRAALADPTFAQLLGERTADIPVAGTVHDTDDLSGRDGFLGGKTGSHDAAGGCFVFRATRPGPDGAPVVVTGAVLGQRGEGSYVDAALAAADQLVDAVTAQG